MDKNILDSLSKDAKYSSKKQEDYQTALMALLDEEGQTAETQKYIIKGCVYYSVFTWVDWINKNNYHPKEYIDPVFNGTELKSANVMTQQKFYLMLLVVSLKYKEKYGNETRSAITRFCVNAVDKTGNVSTKSSPNIINYLFRPLTDDIEYSSFSALELTEKVKQQFVALLRIAKEEFYKKDSNINNVAVKNFLNWVREGTNQNVNTQNQNLKELKVDLIPTAEVKSHEDNAIKELPDQEHGESTMAVTTKVGTETEVSGDKNKNINKPEEKKINSKEKIISDISSLQYYFDKYFSEVEAMNKKNTSTIDALRKRITDLENMNAKLKEENLKAKEKLEQSGTFLIEKENTINELQDNLEKQKSTMAIFQNDTANTHQEEKNAIASNLKQEYLDFSDLANEQDSADLSAVLKTIIQDIFTKLKQSGIEVSGR